MSSNIIDLEKCNPKLDKEVVQAAERLRDQLPMSQRPAKGADYGIAHPFAPRTSSLAKKGQFADTRVGDRRNR